MRGREVLIIFGLIVLGMLSSVSALTLDVFSPLDSGRYGDREVLFNLSSDEVSDFYYTKIADGYGRWVLLCRNVMNCESIKTFVDGSQSVLIRAIDVRGNAQVEGPIDFEIDSKNPKIVRTFPNRNSFENSIAEFDVIYSEQNLKNVTLYYGNGKSKTRSDCESGLNKACKFFIEDLTDEDGQKQEYWFEVIDGFGNFEISKKVEIRVDTTLPVIEYMNHKIEKRRVDFVFDINEINFKEVSYLDRKMEAFGKWHKLCSSLENGLCTKSKLFKPGLHDLTVKVEDEAGNFVLIENLTIAI